jgi:hypothetical protein
MNIEIKNIKYAAFASQETHCFEATLYIDGKRFGHVQNDGHGGCDDVYPLNECKDVSAWRKQLDAIEAELSSVEIETDLPPIDGKRFTLPNSLELVVGDLMNDWHRANELKRLFKRIIYVKPDCGKGEFYKGPAKVKPTADGIALLKKQKWWNPENVVLNELSVKEAAAYL